MSGEAKTPEVLEKDDERVAALADDIHSINTAAVLQAAHELDDNQRQAQALEKEIKEDSSG